MDIALLILDAASFQTPLLAVFAVDIATSDTSEPHPVLLTTSDPLTEAASHVLASGEFKAGLGETLLVHAPVGIRAERLLIVGLGKAKSLTPGQARKGAGSALRAAKPRGIRELALSFPEDRALSDESLDELPCQATMRAIVEGAMLADPDYDTYKSDRKDREVRSLAILARSSERSTRSEMEEGLRQGQIVANAQNFARSLVNEPGNVLTPTELARRTATMCEEVGLRCEVHSTDKLRELKMGAFLAVAQGSEQPPALITMTYDPAETPASDAPVLGLVGKGITFDTGGISIKSADGMEKMKYDMAGAAAMIGAMRALAELKPKNRIIGIICSAENMPDGRAYRPGDVLTAMSGKTIEVINTDAEGRLVLADGLHYAKTLGCTHLINAATLTGACVVALGLLNAGLFSNDDREAGRFQDAMRLAGEQFWRLPCTDDYREQIKSKIADIMNTGGTRWGGAISAAIFLREFVGNTPWLHLDIAGCAWEDDAKSWIAKGPTGIGVRSIVEWAMAPR